MAKASSDFTPILIFGGLAAGAYFLYQNGSLSTLFSSVSSLLPASAGGIAPAVVSTVAASGTCAHSTDCETFCAANPAATVEYTGGGSPTSSPCASWLTGIPPAGGVSGYFPRSTIRQPRSWPGASVFEQSRGFRNTIQKRPLANRGKRKRLFALRSHGFTGSLLSTRLKPAPADWRPRASTLPCSGLGQTTSAYAGIASAIQQQEGYFPGSLSYTLNNPGNLQYAGQAGATPVTANGATWASFSTYAAGFQALENQVALDASRGLTISQFTAKYAPASDGNDPSTYANNISAAVGLSPSDPLSAAAGDGSVSATGSDSSLTDLLGISDNGSFDLSSVSPWVLAGVAAAVLVVAVV